MTSSIPLCVKKRLQLLKYSKEPSSIVGLDKYIKLFTQLLHALLIEFSQNSSITHSTTSAICVKKRLQLQARLDQLALEEEEAKNFSINATEGSLVMKGDVETGGMLVTGSHSIIIKGEDYTVEERPNGFLVKRREGIAPQAAIRIWQQDSIGSFVTLLHYIIVTCESDGKHPILQRLI